MRPHLAAGLSSASVSTAHLLVRLQIKGGNCSALFWAEGWGEECAWSGKAPGTGDHSALASSFTSSADSRGYFWVASFILLGLRFGHVK